MDGGRADGDAEPSCPTRQIRAVFMIIWIGLLLGVCGVAVFVLTSWRRRAQMAELGTLSEQWLSEHRGYDQRHSER